MNEPVIITDYESDWIDFINSKCQEQIKLVSEGYPKRKTLLIDFSQLLSFGDVGRRLAELYLDCPHFTESIACDVIKSKQLVKIIRPYTPGDIRISILKIPHSNLEEICNPDPKQSRSDSKTNAWKGAVKLRDGFSCKKCGCEDELQVHHIIPVNKDPSLAWDINNGITLCKRCHSKFHSEYGVYDLGHYEIHCFLRAPICDEGDQS